MIPFFDGDSQWPLSLGGVRNLSALWESCLQKGISCYLVSPKFSQLLATLIVFTFLSLVEILNGIKPLEILSSLHKFPCSPDVKTGFILS